jgi:hypothetical protein
MGYLKAIWGLCKIFPRNYLGAYVGFEIHEHYLNAYIKPIYGAN